MSSLLEREREALQSALDQAIEERDTYKAALAVAEAYICGLEGSGGVEHFRFLADLTTYPGLDSIPESHQIPINLSPNHHPYVGMRAPITVSIGDDSHPKRANGHVSRYFAHSTYPRGLKVLWRGAAEEIASWDEWCLYLEKLEKEQL
jgi:hypothetical protein